MHTHIHTYTYTYVRTYVYHIAQLLMGEILTICHPQQSVQIIPLNSNSIASMGGLRLLFVNISLSNLSVLYPSKNCCILQTCTHTFALSTILVGGMVGSCDLSLSVSTEPWTSSITVETASLNSL